MYTMHPRSCLGQLKPAGHRRLSGLLLWVLLLAALSMPWAGYAQTSPTTFTTPVKVTAPKVVYSATAAATVRTTSCPFALPPITLTGFDWGTSWGEVRYNYFGGTYEFIGTETAPSWNQDRGSGSWIRVYWSSTNDRWEIKNAVDYLYATNTTGSITNLPSLGWQRSSDAIRDLVSAPTISSGSGTLERVALVSISPSSQTITAGGSVTLTASGADSYSWSDGSTDNPLIVRDIASPMTFSVTGTCDQTLSATATATVSVTQPPAVTLVVGASPNPVCAGSSATLSVTATGGVQPYTYNWQAPAGVTLGSPTSQSTVTASATLSGVYALTVTVSSANSGPVNSSTVNLTVNPAVTASIVGNQNISCGQSLTLTASGGDGFLWSANANSATSSQVVVQPGQTGTVYSVTVTDPGTGCSGVASVTATLTPAMAVQAISTTVISELSATNCPVIIQAVGTGNAFVFTNPATGSSYSTVYRTGGTYPMSVPVKQPGTYTMTAWYTDACGQSSTDTRTFVVTGTGCN